VTGNGNGRAHDPAELERALHRRLMRFGEAETLATPMWEQRGTSVPAVEAQLSRLWEAEAAAEDGDELVVTPKGLAHARASVLNLIVTVRDEDAADRVVETMTGLGIRHPSRAIVLVAEPGAVGEPLDARISTHCQNTGAENRVCYEEVVLTIRGEAAEHLAGVVAPLLIHDLPTHVWWPGDPPFGDPIFDQLVALADRVIVDSSDFANLLDGSRRLASLRRRCGIGDLAWERLAWWQELTAQFFDAPRFRRYLANLNSLRIRYAVPAEVPAERFDGGAPAIASPLSQAILYAGWLAARLDWKRWRTTAPLGDGRLELLLEGRHEMVGLRIEPQPTDRVAAGGLTAMSLKAHGETGAAEFIIDRHADEATVATNADGMTALLRRVSMEPDEEPELLSRQLVVERSDPIYEAALRAAAVLLDAARGERARA
jgi:glucose-6-phosphate dehydrogenase assembly protein OpcA